MTRQGIDEFVKLLASESHSSHHEQDVQAYLEDNPYLLPGLWDRHNGPIGNVVVTKPQLGDFEPDFAFVSHTTAEYQYTLIEIEDPCKPIFTKRDNFTQKFRQAQQQVKDWVGAWDQIEGRLKSIFFPAQESYSDWKHTYCKGYLVYGRRAEVESTRTRRERWSAETGNWGPGAPVEIMTYDRLVEPGPFEVPAAKARLRTYRYNERILVVVRSEE